MLKDRDSTNKADGCMSSRSVGWSEDEDKKEEGGRGGGRRRREEGVE